MTVETSTRSSSSSSSSSSVATADLGTVLVAILLWRIVAIQVRGALGGATVLQVAARFSLATCAREAKAVDGVVVVGVGALELVPVGGAELTGHLPFDGLAGVVDALDVGVVEMDWLGVGTASSRVLYLYKNKIEMRSFVKCLIYFISN